MQYLKLDGSKNSMCSLCIQCTSAVLLLCVCVCVQGDNGDEVAASPWVAAGPGRWTKSQSAAESVGTEREASPISQSGSSSKR